MNQVKKDLDGFLRYMEYKLKWPTFAPTLPLMTFEQWHRIVNEHPLITRP